MGLGLAALGKAPVEVQPLYRVASGFYDEIAFIWQDWLYADAYRALDQALGEYLSPGGHVLDLGSGTGANLERLLQLGLSFGSYMGVDQSQGMLDRAREKFGYLENAEFVQLNLITDSLPEGSFDLIISSWAFEHLPDVGQVVEKAWERLRPGGYMLLFFEIAGDSLRSHLVGWIWPWFSAHLVREGAVHRFPGLVSFERFTGAGAPLALVVLQRPAADASR